MTTKIVQTEIIDDSKRKCTPRVWTDERVKQLRRLVDKGLSGGMVAEELSRQLGVQITRNMVISTAARHGIQFSSLFTRPKGRVKGVPRPKRESNEAPRRKLTKTRGNPWEAHMVEPHVPVESATLLAFNDAIPSAQRKQLTDLESARSNAGGAGARERRL